MLFWFVVGRSLTSMYMFAFLLVSLLLTDLIQILEINPFNANVPFLYPLKTKGFLTFLGGIEMGNWRENG